MSRLFSNPGKLGISLSGGGFRAAFFHIGVLADLAEKNLLKEAQVISTVSGGSIIGGLYYLKVKQFLEGKRKEGTSPQKNIYVTILKEIESEFLQAVQKNLRMRTFADPFRNIKMMRADYSRSDRISELYTKHIYEPVWDEISRGTDIQLKNLKIIPHKDFWPAGMEDFDFKKYQEAAEHKIPVLIINATTLNTGHCWQFTASWVGEKNPKLAVKDANTLLEPLYFDDESLTKKQRKKLDTLLLGDAVASSACVPAIFKPFAIHDLYTIDKKEYIVQLVDGGVYDNQGLHTLHEQQCKRIICSDGSMQMVDIPKPTTGTGAVFMQANDILMDRVRDYELNYLSSLPDVEEVFLHLKDYESVQLHHDKEKNQKLVDALSAIRTDLDSFTDNEAYSLMYFGYRISEHKIQASKQSTGWTFAGIQHKIDHEYNRLLKQLEIGCEKAFKVFHLSSLTKWITVLIFALAGTGLLYNMYNSPRVFHPEVSATSIAAVTVIALVFMFLGSRIKKTFHDIPFLNLIYYGIGEIFLFILLIPLAFSLFLSLAIGVHLLVYDFIFLRIGKK